MTLYHPISPPSMKNHFTLYKSVWCLMNALAKVALCPSRNDLRIRKASVSNLTLSALLGWYEIQMKFLWHYFHIEKVVSERHFTKWNCTNFSHFWEWKTYWSLACWIVTQYNASNPLGQTGEELTPLEYRFVACSSSWSFCTIWLTSRCLTVFCRLRSVSYFPFESRR